MTQKQVVNHLKIDMGESNLEKDALKVLAILRPSWPKSSVRFKKFQEGKMNILVGCYLDGKFDEDVVLIRKYGNNTSLMVDRKTEIDVISTLSQEGICMPLYATLNNGIAYGFVHGETLNVDTIRDEHIASLIAREMAKMHSIKTGKDNPKPGLFKKLDEWIEKISDSLDNPVMQNRNIRPKEWLYQEKAILKRELLLMECPVVLCHNDLAIANIIYNKEKDEVKFIDFEFASYNYSAFDIGNHFLEYAGVDEADHSYYPDKDYQMKWIRNYLTCLKEYNSEETIVTDNDVEILYIQANKCALVGYFICGLWALIQTKNANIDFDYLGYAKKQFDEYDKKRRILFIEHEHQFPCCYLPQHRYDPVIMINQQVVQMQIEIDENHINESAIKILEILRPSWHKREIKFKRFHEGRMNTLVGCYLDGKFDEDVVLIRKYGNNTNLLVNRKEETDIIKILSQEGICMPLYATLSNGIAYGFIHGEKLNVETVRDEHISRLIAKEMAKLHSIKTKGDNPKPKLFDKLDKWMEYIPHSFEDPALPSRLILSQEKDKLRRELESLDCPVVLCHNDLGITNIIYNKEKDEVKFIDFEFAGYNFSAFDIGEHFSEYAGVSGVDHGSYPDKDYQLKWIRNYLTYLKQYYNEEKAVTDKDVEKLYVQANKFAPVGNFVWGLWALIQIKHGDTGFNYLGAAKTQFAEYFKKRQNE